MAIGAMLVIAAVVWLKAPLEYNGKSINGIEVVKDQPWWFWLTAILGVFLAGFCFYLAFAISEGVGLGKNIRAGDWAPIKLAGMGFVFLLAPWIIPANEKANGGWLNAKTEQVK